MTVTLPIPRGNAPLCACGCGNRTSTVRTEFVLGHRPSQADKAFVWERSVIDTQTGCINWTGAMYPNGYGMVRRGDKGRMAHRVAYELFVGPIPDGLVIDHLCRNRRCVNVTHLEPVTAAVNAERGGGLLIAAANYRARTHCPKKHAYTPENTYIDREGKRSCKQCGREASLRTYYKNRDAQR